MVTGSVSWLLRRALGMPMRVFDVQTELTCPGCNTHVQRPGGASNQPPLRHRFGGVLFFGVLATLPIAALVIAMPPGRDHAAERRYAESEALIARGNAERDRYKQRLVECRATWRRRIDALGAALATAPEVPLPEDQETRLLTAPVLPANEASEELARRYENWDPQIKRGPHCAAKAALEAHLGASPDVEETRAAVERWTSGMTDIADSDTIVVADYRCAARSCTSTLAMIDRDGRVIALSRARARPDQSPAYSVGRRIETRSPRRPTRALDR